ncbi:MAG TPA: DUF2934 domain-containing protein [Gemmatimonadaceae bacterium]|nr:DUF2934 domain-containing protein [Gemmatimonadaceae bacterium]
MKDSNERKNSRPRRKPAEPAGDGASEVKRPARKRAAATQQMSDASAEPRARQAQEPQAQEQPAPEQRPEEMITQEMPARETSARVPLVDERRAAQSSETEQEQRSVAPEEEIRVRAYMLYCERGYEPGNDLEDWLRAEREFQERSRH